MRARVMGRREAHATSHPGDFHPGGGMHFHISTKEGEGRLMEAGDAFESCLEPFFDCSDLNSLLDCFCGVLVAGVCIGDRVSPLQPRLT